MIRRSRLYAVGDEFFDVESPKDEDAGKVCKTTSNATKHACSLWGSSTRTSGGEQEVFSDKFVMEMDDSVFVPDYQSADVAQISDRDSKEDIEACIEACGGSSARANSSSLFSCTVSYESETSVVGKVGTYIKNTSVGEVKKEERAIKK